MKKYKPRRFLSSPGRGGCLGKVNEGRERNNKRGGGKSLPLLKRQKDSEKLKKDSCAFRGRLNEKREGPAWLRFGVGAWNMGNGMDDKPFSQCSGRGKGGAEMRGLKGIVGADFSSAAESGIVGQNEIRGVWNSGRHGKAALWLCLG